MNILRRALNSEQQAQAPHYGATLAVLNTDFSLLPATADQAPAWVELTPAGPVITGRDGRRWLFDEPAQQLVLSSFTARAADLPIDWEHATQYQSPSGSPAPAGGWNSRLEIRDGTLWGEVSWTPRAEAQVVAREYRFLSPVFDYLEDSSRIVRLVSAGPTNQPNLVLTALNQESPTPESTDVKISAALLALLGPPETATEQEAIAVATNLQQTAQAANGKPQFAPRRLRRPDPARDQRRTGAGQPSQGTTPIDD